jgi:RNA polymerase sigma-70 factor, ECF subfamily
MRHWPGVSASHVRMPPEEASFDDILGPLIRPGYQLAVAMLGDRGLAEDAVRDAAVSAWRKLPRLRDRTALRPWFMTIVANQCRTTRRRRWWTVLKLAEVRGEPSRGVVDERAIASVDVERGLAKLAHQDLLALYLHFYLDMTYEEVGQVMGLSMTAARSRIHRALPGTGSGATTTGIALGPDGAVWFTGAPVRPEVSTPIDRLYRVTADGTITELRLPAGAGAVASGGGALWVARGQDRPEIWRVDL